MVEWFTAVQEFQFPFEKLRLWQEARAWVQGIYLLTRQFPADERFGLTSQINRAAVSVPTNLAEGCGRTSLKDQAHFSQIAYASLLETVNLLIIAADQGFVSPVDLGIQRDQSASLCNQINALRKSQVARAA